MMLFVSATSLPARTLSRLAGPSLVIGAVALTLTAICLISVVAACLVAPMITVVAVMVGIATGTIRCDYG